ncbi:hypothetical protein [Arsenophonus endosymbiont of Bemisia tabaci]|nr:hypothetical protein [Arsenophonus endosymbiont of Bemisia tabaci]
MEKNIYSVIKIKTLSYILCWLVYRIECVNMLSGVQMKKIISIINK